MTALNSAETNALVIIKNIELFDKRVFDVVGKINKLIISGDINKVSFKDELLKNNFSTKVYFNSLDGKEVHQLEKFQGLIVADDLEGVTQIL